MKKSKLDEKLAERGALAIQLADARTALALADQALTPAALASPEADALLDAPLKQERRVKALVAALDELDREIPEAREGAFKTRSDAFALAEAQRGDERVREIAALMDEAESKAQDLTATLAREDELRREHAWASAGLRLLAVRFGMKVPVLPPAPAYRDTLSAPLQIVGRTHKAKPFDVVGAAPGSPEYQSAKWTALRLYLQKHRRSLPAEVVAILDGAAIPEPVPTEAQTKLVADQAERDGTFAAELARVAPAPGTRHGV